MKKVILITLFGLLSACGGNTNQTITPTTNQPPVTTIPSPNTGNNSDSVILTFIHMNDLHANLVAHNELFRHEGSPTIEVTNAGGIAKMATAIKLIRSQHPDSNILMNIGDTFHGTGEALFSNGNAIVDPVNQLNIDIGVPGNWDYAYGPIVTNARFGNLTNADVQRPNYPMLAANAHYKIPEMLNGNPLGQIAVQNIFKFSAGDPFLPASKIIERQGIKIGFIGLTSDIVEKIHPLLAFNIDFVQGKENYLNLLNEQSTKLKEQGANIVVVMSELGLQKDWALAKALDKDMVQVFFSAHTHETTAQPLVADNGTIVVESGNDSYLGQMDITFTNGVISATQWQLHRLDSNVQNDAQMLTLVAQKRAPFLVETPNITIPKVSLGNNNFNDLLPTPSEQKLLHSLDETIYNTTLALDRKHSLESNFNNFFSDLLRINSQADVAISPGFRFGAVIIPAKDNFSGADNEYKWQSETPELLNGEIKISDVYRFFPAPYNIASGTTSIANLKNIIEQNLAAVYSTEIFNQAGGWVDGFSGIDLQVDLSATMGKRIQSLTFTGSGATPSNDSIINVTGCARPFDLEAQTTLCAYSGFENVSPLINPNSGTPYASADYFIDQLMIDNPVLQEIKSRESIKEQSGQSMWPISPYVQPLEGVKKP